MINFGNPSRRRFLGLTGALGASMMMPSFTRGALAASSFPARKEEDTTVAFTYVGPVSDEGWTWSHHQGMLAVKKAFPKIKTVEIENVPYSADATRIYRQLVSDGAGIVFDSANYGDLLYAASDAAPDVAWFECDGRRTAANMGFFYIDHWYPTYVIGVAAGMLSKSGKLGYVGSFPVPSVYSGTNAFLMGARSVNPKATLQAVMINSWFDPQGASQAATALVDNGCDFLFGIMDEAAYLQVAEKRGVWAAMWNTDMRRYGPKSYVSSLMLDWNKFYVNQTQMLLDGKWTGGQKVLLPMGGGIDRDKWGENVPKDVQVAADAVRTKMMGGWTPFVGEMKDTKGKVRVKAGETMDDMTLYNWDWAIEGVSGVG